MKKILFTLFLMTALMTLLYAQDGMSGIKSDGTSYRILIVENSGFAAAQLKNILTDEGFKIIGSVRNGGASVDTYEKLHPNVDVVILDIEMSRMDGITALEKILQYDEKAKVVMISSLGMKDSAGESIEMGAKSYIVKPFDRYKVIERVEIALRK